MWQLKRLSTNEVLSEAGPLPNNWGPIFGLHGFLDKLGDLSWLGLSYVDMGWVELADTEKKALKEAEVMDRVNSEKSIANTALSSLKITIEGKMAWVEYLLALDAVCRCPDFDRDPKFPIRPNV